MALLKAPAFLVAVVAAAAVGRVSAADLIITLGGAPLFSIPLLIIAAGAFLHWRARNRPVAFTLVVFVAPEIFWYGLTGVYGIT